MNHAALPLASEATTTARGSLYWLLSLAFKYPSAEVFAAYQDGDFFDELQGALTGIPHLKGLGEAQETLARDLRNRLTGVTFKEFQVSYTQTFDVGAPKAPCPPYEGIYRPGTERTVVLLELTEFYKHFGLAMSREEGKRELPDHLSAELQFLNFLTFKEAQARAECTTDLLHGYLLAQRDFLDRHLLPWLPAFCTKLRQAAGGESFFSEFAKLTVDVTRRDFEWLGVELAAEAA